MTEKQSAREPDYWLGYGLQAYTKKPSKDATPVWIYPPPTQDGTPEKLEEMKAILDEIVSYYEADIKAKYAGTLNFPCRQRDYDADMDVIHRAKRLLENNLSGL